MHFQKQCVYPRGRCCPRQRCHKLPLAARSAAGSSGKLDAVRRIKYYRKAHLPQ